MAIRFQCAACGQPIEIDDEWALRAVACPYCRKTITAPAESTLPDPAHIPVAVPLASSLGGPMDGFAPPGGLTAPLDTRRNTWAVVALVLAVAVFVLVVISIAITLIHGSEMEELAKAGMSPAKQQEALSKLREDYGGSLPAWLVASLAVGGATCAVWPAAVICGVIGVFRARQRRLAVAALVITGVELAYFVCGGVAQMAA
jgi:hypothetical protein